VKRKLRHPGERKRGVQKYIVGSIDCNLKGKVLEDNDNRKVREEVEVIDKEK
jgi:hypothetical protein